MMSTSTDFARRVLAGLVLCLAFLGIGTGTWFWRTRSDPVEVPSVKGPVTPDVAPSGGLVDVKLDPDKQKQIWDAEHVTFEIEKRFGKGFTAALRAGDSSRLMQFFRDDFSGSVPLAFQEERLEQAGVTEVTATADGEERSADAAAIVQHLVSWLDGLSNATSSSLRVLAIEPLHEGPPRWQTTLLLTAAGHDADGRSIERESRHRATFEIVDEEALDNSASLVRWTVLSETRRASRPQRLFEEVTERLGLDRANLPDNWKLDPAQVSQYRFQVAVDDFNRDGLLDIAAATHSESLLLTRNSVDEPFRDATEELGLRRQHARWRTPGSLTSWIDANNDGYPDLLLGTRFYFNDEGRGFVDRTEESGLKFLPAPGSLKVGEPMGACVADYNGDGLLDLYVVKQGSSRVRGTPTSWVQDHVHGHPNQLWRNLGNGRFVDMTNRSGTGGGNRHSLAACWFHFDEDHFPDLYVANDFGRNVLLRNRGDGTFADVSEASGAADFATTMGVAAGDLNNDAISELYVANMYSKMGRRIIGFVGPEDYPPGIYEQIQGSCAGNRLYWRHDRRQPFTEHGSKLRVDAVGWAYAPAMLDVNNDGLLDLYATTGFLSFDRGKPDG